MCVSIFTYCAKCIIWEHLTVASKVTEEDVDKPITSVMVKWCGQVITSVSLVRPTTEPKLSYKGNWEM